MECQSFHKLWHSFFYIIIFRNGSKQNQSFHQYSLHTTDKRRCYQNKCPEANKIITIDTKYSLIAVLTRFISYNMKTKKYLLVVP